MVRPLLILALLAAACGGTPAAPEPRQLSSRTAANPAVSTEEAACAAVEASVACAPGSVRATALGPVGEDGTRFCEVSCAPSGEFARVNVTTAGFEQRGQLREGRRDGTWRTWEADESLARRLVLEESYVDGLLDGPRRRWYTTGARREEAHYRADRLLGTQREFSPTGVVVYEGEFLDGVPVGTARTRHLNGQLASERQYDSAGLPHGSWCFYANDGAQLGCSTFDHGTGVLIEYDRSGARVREIAMQGGERHGRYVEELPDGTRYESEFREGDEHGVGRRIAADGCVEREVTYVDGQPQGPVLERSCADGVAAVTLEGQHCAGLHCGRWIERDPRTGKKTAEYQYADDGTLLATVRYDEQEQVRDFSGAVEP